MILFEAAVPPLNVWPPTLPANSATSSPSATVPAAMPKFLLKAVPVAADSKLFIEFILEAIYEALIEVDATEQVGEQVAEQVLKLLDAIGQDTLTSKELMERVALKHRPTFRQNYLLPAIDQGYIEMTIPDKPNSSKQKYRRKNL